MRIALVEPFGGASGDMFLAALINAGADEGALIDSLARLGIPGLELKISNTTRAGIAATAVEVAADNEQPSRHLPEILELIEKAQLPGRTAELAARVFQSLASAEAEVHGIEADKVHFHEVGAVDSIADVVGTCAAIEQLEIDKLYCREVILGGGEITCAHGMLPCPAPATLKLLAGLPARFTASGSEMTTPTGAAILATLCDFTRDIPAFKLGQSGYGAGRRDDAGRPNVLRVTLGETTEKKPALWVVEASIDDMNPELYAKASESIFESGALDVYFTPVQMKKSRPGTVLTALCPHDALLEVERAFLMNTTTFGVRRYRVERTELERKVETADTPYGQIRVKLGILDGKIVTVSPEYESCLSAARESEATVKEVYAAAIASFASP